MSETVAETSAAATADTGAVEAPAAPQTTEAITANVIEQLDAADSQPPDAEARVDTTDVAATVEKPKTEPVTPRDLSVEEQLLAEFGFKDARRPDGREHYIARSKVLQMIGSGLKRGQARWDGERQGYEGKIKELSSHLDEVRTDVTGDTRAFLAKLAQADPRYRAFLEPQAAQQAAPAVDDRPKPDVDLGNGQWTYSVEGVEKLAAWKAQQLLDARFKPWEEQQKEAQQRAKQDELRNSLRESTNHQMQEAQTWTGFGTLAADGTLNEFQTAVLKRLQDDSAKAAAANRRPSMTLKEAYLEERAERLAADDASKRAKWMEEMNQAPRSTSVTRSSAEPNRPRGPRSIEEITRETLERMGA